MRVYKEGGHHDYPFDDDPFDMVMRNNLGRVHIDIDVMVRVPSLGSHAATLRQQMADVRLAARQYTREHDETRHIAIWTAGPGLTGAGTGVQRRILERETAGCSMTTTTPGTWSRPRPTWSRPAGELVCYWAQRLRLTKGSRVQVRPRPQVVPA
jgi:hypothetical protein